MRIIPPRGSIPANIRGKRGLANFGLNIHIGGLGLGGNRSIQQPQDDFKPRVKARENPAPKEKINLEDMKKFMIEELAHLIELGERETKKYKWLVNMIPEVMVEEIIKAAKILAKKPG